MSCCNIVVTTTSEEVVDDFGNGEFYFEQKLTDFVRAEKISFSNVCLTLVSAAMVYVTGIFFGFRGADIFVLMVVAVVLFMAFGGNKKIFLRKPKDANEKWSISLTQTHLAWLSPPTMVEKSNELSFEIKISNIEKIQQSYSVNDETAPYTFFLNNGSRINPGLYSSVNMTKLVALIQRHDIKFEYVPEFDS